MIDRGFLLAALILLSGCGDGPSDLADAPDVLLVAGGDGQLAPPSTTLPIPLRVSVRRASDDAPSLGATLRWSIVEGFGAQLANQVTVTGSDGIGQNRLSLGSASGAYRVRVAAEGGTSVEFRAWAVEPPRLESIQPAVVEAGGRVRLRGRSFRADPAQNLVLFDGFRGRVVSAADSLLEVEVPACLRSRRVVVTVFVGSAGSAGVHLDVGSSGAQPVSLGVGQGRSTDVADGTECQLLAGNATYLLVVQSAGSIGGGLYGYSLRGAGAGPPRLASVPMVTPDQKDERSALSESGSSFERRLRDFEDDALRAAEPAALPIHGRAPSAAVPPRVGERVRFHVLDSAGGFQEVESVARLVSARVALFVDVETPSAAFSEADLQGLASDLDDPVFRIVTDAFGAPSDVDGNERVIILLTPAVNRLTPSASAGYVGGFFFGVDLLPTRNNSNRAEVLYAMVPDPSGEFGAPRSRELVLGALPAILAHELQHMVHFNERMLVRQAAKNEALWLQEALAQSAETLVGDSLLRRGETARAARYLEPTYHRARVFLQEPSPVSLLVSAGGGSLGERGAGWLFLRYLQGHHPRGGAELLRSLTRTTRAGLENVEATTGRSWSDSFSDWSVATFTDGLDHLPMDRLQYPDFDVRAELGGGAYPLVPESLGEDFDRTGTRLTASSQYFLLTSARPVAVRLADRSGGPPPPEARFILRVVRVQ